MLYKTSQLTQGSPLNMETSSMPSIQPIIDLSLTFKIDLSPSIIAAATEYRMSMVILKEESMICPIIQR